jgi:ComF family protein
LKSIWVNNWLEKGQGWLFPSICALCGVRSTHRHDLCQDCCAELPYQQAACRVCALPLPNSGICGRCLREAPSFDQTHAVFHYAPPVDFFIKRLKFDKKLNYARLLARLMALELSRRYPDASGLPDVIIPVPLHKSRLRSRGYNQALELARPIAAFFNIPLDYQCCARMRDTALQSDLPAALRRKNVKDAFQSGRIKADHVVIVDDVMTTGHTVNELARMMREGGVNRIDVWICARAS